MSKKAILLINIGTPAAPTTKAVKSYLKEFLNDPLVIEMPDLHRKILVNGIIVPLRAKKSARRYQQLWTKDGSPLLIHLKNLRNKLQANTNEYEVFAAMNYGEPQLTDVLKEIEAQHFEELTVLPLFPHYTTSTTLSTIQKVQIHTQHWQDTKVRFINHFYEHPAYIAAVCEQIGKYKIADYDHLLFSYHSLPLTQVAKSYDGNRTYDQACVQTTALIAKQLQLNESDYSNAYQSRFSKKWLAPYTNDVLEELANAGKKKVLVITPSFVADCLETTVEIAQEYLNFFITKGGEQMNLVPCPNDSDAWVEGLWKIIEEQ